MKSNNIHLVEKQRDPIEIMLNEGKLLKAIAATLSSDPRDIKYEDWITICRGILSNFC